MLDSYKPKWYDEPPHPPDYDEDVKIHSEVMEILRARGVNKLYAHQAKAVRAIRDGKNIVLMAPTAAGKTECYMIPVIEAALEGGCTLMLFPTKALSRDQWNRVREFNLLGVRSAVYDGDTPESQRMKVRNDMPHIIITNVDMLHYMLGNWRIWRPFFAKLKYVVVDEVHAYSGTLGSHVANVLWRLRRLLDRQTQRPAKVQFIASSATVGNAAEFAGKLCGLGDFELISGEGAPRGVIHHGVISDQEESTVSTSLKVAKELGKKTLIFGNSHNMVERLGMVGRKMGLKVAVYRSGLPPEERRELEAGFHSGRVPVMAATSALELGMDVGDADVAILAGFPGTVTRLRQRIGRVGRKGQECYAVMVARDNPLDQYYAANPKTYLEGKAESCFAKPDNPFVRSLHLLSAARDWPLEEGDLKEGDGPLLQKLLEEGMIKKWSGGIVPTPAGMKKVRSLSLRNAGTRVRILDAGSNQLLGEREEPLAISELYPGAIYLMGGRRYVSKGIDLDEGVAKVERLTDDEPYYTQALKSKQAEVLDVEEERRWGGVEMGRGAVHITNEVHGYVLKDSFRGTTIRKVELEKPLTHEFDTHALWADWEMWADNTASYAEGLHALEHVSIAMMPALTGADPAEIGGISYPQGRIFYYEGAEGGSGLSQTVMLRYGECIRMTLDRLASCACEDGCPSCIYSPQCGNNNYYLSKGMAKTLAEKGLKAAKEG